MEEDIFYDGKIGTINEPVISDEVTIEMLGEVYVLPAVRHPQNTEITVLAAALVKMSQRVDELEKQIKGE
jgi:hypothetical protein